MSGDQDLLPKVPQKVAGWGLEPRLPASRTQVETQVPKGSCHCHLEGLFRSLGVLNEIRNSRSLVAASFGGTFSEMVPRLYLLLCAC
jgi:hypothetical protein